MGRCKVAVVEACGHCYEGGCRGRSQSIRYLVGGCGVLLRK